MTPKLTGIDHVHVYVKDRARAEDWYKDVLGFTRIEELVFWAVGGGPLTLENPAHNAHLALFERAENTGATTTAFGSTGQEFLAWKTHLEDKGLELRINDHTVAYSLYFYDPDRNMYEITTYDHELVRASLA